MSDTTAIAVSEFGWKPAEHGVVRMRIDPERIDVVARGADRVLILSRNGAEVYRSVLPPEAAARLAALLAASPV